MAINFVPGDRELGLSASIVQPMEKLEDDLTNDKILRARLRWKSVMGSPGLL